VGLNAGKGHTENPWSKINLEAAVDIEAKSHFWVVNSL
jgi:hypothetical protein